MEVCSLQLAIRSTRGGSNITSDKWLTDDKPLRKMLNKDQNLQECDPSAQDKLQRDDDDSSNAVWHIKKLCAKYSYNKREYFQDYKISNK